MGKNRQHEFEVWAGNVLTRHHQQAKQRNKAIQTPKVNFNTTFDRFFEGIIQQDDLNKMQSWLKLQHTEEIEHFLNSFSGWHDFAEHQAIALSELKKREEAGDKITFRKIKEKLASGAYNTKTEQKPIQIAEILQITYSENTCEIWLNDLIVIGKPHYNSGNEKLFRYVYKNPNRDIPLKELEKHGAAFNQKPATMLRDLGFYGRFGKAFFTASEKGITFRNPITSKT